MNMPYYYFHGTHKYNEFNIQIGIKKIRFTHKGADVIETI